MDADAAGVRVRGVQTTPPNNCGTVPKGDDVCMEFVREVEVAGVVTTAVETTQ